MKLSLLLSSFFMITTSLNAQTEVEAWVQKSAQTHNGIQDADENGVDCYKVPTPGYNKCNGLLDIDLNGTQYKISLNQVISQPLGTNKRASILMLMSNTYNDGTMQSGFGLTFTLYCNPLKEDVYILKKDPQAVLGGAGLKHGIFTMNIDFKHSGVVIEIKKIKHGEFNITAIDRINRIISGEVDIDAMTVDQTPIKLKGTFNNIGY